MLLMLRVLSKGGSAVIYGKVKDGAQPLCPRQLKIVTVRTVSNGASDLDRSSAVAV
jgi:hypothetical protein